MNGWLRIAGCVAALWALAAPAAAQDDPARAEAARALFEEGVDLSEESKWQEASERFRRALELKDSPVIAYNLAIALEKLGKLSEASTVLRRVQAGAEAYPELRKSAAGMLAELAGRLGLLTIHVQGREPGDRIALDDRVLPDAELDVPLAIDPGRHVVTAQRGGQTLDSQSIESGAGTSQELTLNLTRVPEPRDVAAAAVGTPIDRAVTDSGDDGAVTGTWWFWTGVGTAAVGAAVVAVLLATSGGSGEQEPLRGDFDPPVIGVEVAP